MLATLGGGVALGDWQVGSGEAPVTWAARISGSTGTGRDWAVWEQRKGWVRLPAPFSLLQLGPGSPPGVWVCSTDMLLTVPPDPGEPEKVWDCLLFS